MVRVTEQRFADQVRTILKSKWFTAVELEEIKRKSCIETVKNKMGQLL